MTHIRYGIEGKYLDITNLAINQCFKDNILDIPSDRNQRIKLFGDHLPDIDKEIVVEENGKITPYTPEMKLDLKLIPSSPVISIKYGVHGRYTDVTNIALTECVKNNIFTLPPGDGNRAAFFGDPLPFILKNISITEDGKERICADNETIVIDTSFIDRTKIVLDPSYVAEKRLQKIHEELKFQGGSIKDEYPEQIMAVMFIKPNNKVIEIGSNIGRNTLTIASLLDNQSNLVTLECDPISYKQLLINRDLNNYTFRAENAALSAREMILNGWESIPSDVVLPGFKRVETITYSELEKKYDIIFDTLVADCEGALYYIFLDFPELLNKIETVILENDFLILSHKETVDDILHGKGFLSVYQKPGPFGASPDRFYEVWTKSIKSLPIPS